MAPKTKGRKGDFETNISVSPAGASALRSISFKLDPLAAKLPWTGSSLSLAASLSGKASFKQTTCSRSPPSLAYVSSEGLIQSCGSTEGRGCLAMHGGWQQNIKCSSK